METVEELIAKLSELNQLRARDQVLARGLARGMIWREGDLPPDSPRFATTLTNDLLNHGYAILGCALRLRTLDAGAPILDDSFRNAAEAIEAAVRRGVRDEERGFHLTIAGASFHLGHYAARSFSLLAEERESLNLSSVERLLVALMQRRLGELELLCESWLLAPENNDEGVVAQLKEENQFGASDAARVAVTRVFHRALSYFDFAIRSGDIDFVTFTTKLLDSCIEAAEQLRHVPLWWSSILARHLVEDLWDRSLHNRLPLGPDDNQPWRDARRKFIDLVSQRDIAEIDLWPSQLAAADRVLNETDSLVVALPTSSGKTRIAELCILRCLSAGRRVIYVTPLRALSAQIEITMARTFQPLGFSVTSVYGASGIGASDVETMASASIVVATPEKLDFAIRQSPEAIDDVGLIVLDEGHMIGLSEREIRYEVLVQRLLRRADAANRRIVCLSAIFTEGDAFDSFTRWIRSDRPGEAIRSQWRPTRQRPATLEWRTDAAWLEYQVHGETVFVPRFIESQPARRPRRVAFPRDRGELVVATIKRFHQDGHSVLVYCPLRSSVEVTADACLKAEREGFVTSFLPNEHAAEIQTALRIGREWLGADHIAMKALSLGIAVHHGELPRPFLGEIERLLRKQILKIAICSPTLAQGIDLSFSVLILNSLWRSRKLIPAKEFANVIGRVGRAYVDLDGIYVLPVRDNDARKQRERLGEFHLLVRQAGRRELESGLFLLISVCLRILGTKLNVPAGDIINYVANQQTAINSFAKSDDEEAELMRVVLAELDAGLFALIDDLGCNSSDLAARIDDALKSSYWERRLQVRELSEQQAHRALLEGRAKHIWTRTNSAQRVGFFGASIGTESGLQIVAQCETLREYLSQCANAIEHKDVSSLAAGCTGLATAIFEIYPFQPKSLPGNWKQILTAWIEGKPLANTVDSDGIAFVQDGLVYRLVWGIEAVRIILRSETAQGQTEEAESEDDGETQVALCMTYGVPSVAAARMLEAGMESRTLAWRIVNELGLEFSTREGLQIWLGECDEAGPVTLSTDELASWKKFLANNKPTSQTWHRQIEKVVFKPISAATIKPGMRVRAVTDDDGDGVVYSPDFERLGTFKSELSSSESLIGIVSGRAEVQFQRFGPWAVPAWIRQLTEDR